ncbi:MAG: DNA repair and recombination protein RadB [Candidatus Aenigmatarchaeota archaeon]
MKLTVATPIDKLLNGGIESGCITNFYGVPASGKSQVALQACVSCVESGKRAVFVDTEGGFSLERLEQISSGKKTAKNIILLEPKSWKEQNESMMKLEKLCKKENIGLIVVDSIVALWRLEITDNNFNEVNRELASQLALLSKISRDRNIPILVTNQVYADLESGKIELSSKNIVKWWSKNMVELSHAGRTGCRIARIAKARSLPEDKHIEFQIAQEGLKEVSKFRVF